MTEFPWETEDLIDIGLTLLEMEELRKTISISMSKLEAKIRGMEQGSRPHRTALHSYKTLSRIYETLQDAITEEMEGTP